MLTNGCYRYRMISTAHNSHQANIVVPKYDHIETLVTKLFLKLKMRIQCVLHITDHVKPAPSAALVPLSDETRCTISVLRIL